MASCMLLRCPMEFNTCRSNSFLMSSVGSSIIDCETSMVFHRFSALRVDLMVVVDDLVVEEEEAFWNAGWELKKSSELS